MNFSMNLFQNGHHPHAENGHNNPIYIHGNMVHPLSTYVDSSLSSPPHLAPQPPPSSSSPSPQAPFSHSFIHKNHPSSSSSSSSSNYQRNPFICRSPCVVCGDRARGCNFGAITCASCKEFFRRNAFKSNVTYHKLKCYFQSQCDINIYSRRFCASCRLAKCYQMGMKSEYIMSDAEKQERNMKIIGRKFSHGSNMSHKHLDDHHHFQDEQKLIKINLSRSLSTFSESELILEENPTILHSQNNHHHHHNQLQHDHYYYYQPDSSESYHNQQSSETNNNNNNGSLDTNQILRQQQHMLQDHKSKDKEQQQHHHHHHHSDDLEDPETVGKLLKTVKIIKESSYSHSKFHFLLLSKKMNQKLSKHGSCKLRYLTSKVQILSAEIVSNLPTDKKFIELIQVGEIMTFNFIKMCKKLYAFQELSQEDQVALVKDSLMDTLMLWSIMTINLEKECWEALDLERNFRFLLKMETLKEANPKLYEKHLSYVMSFEHEWRHDDNLMSLLIAIALFNPERPNLSNIRIINNERNAYCNLMKLYLKTLYEESSNEIYRRLMNQLKLTEEISEYHKKAYFDLSTNEATRKGFGGMMVEIFDLSNR